MITNLHSLKPKNTDEMPKIYHSLNVIEIQLNYTTSQPITLPRNIFLIYIVFQNIYSYRYSTTIYNVR